MRQPPVTPDPPEPELEVVVRHGGRPALAKRQMKGFATSCSKAFIAASSKAAEDRAKQRLGYQSGGDSARHCDHAFAKNDVRTPPTCVETELSIWLYRHRPPFCSPPAVPHPARGSVSPARKKHRRRRPMTPMPMPSIRLNIAAVRAPRRRPNRWRSCCAPADRGRSAAAGRLMWSATSRTAPATQLPRRARGHAV